MNIEQLCKLIDAGFTKEDILAMQGIARDEQVPSSPNEKPEVSLEDRVAEVVKNTMSQYAKANIMTANQPKQDTVDDILAQILTPSNIR